MKLAIALLLFFLQLECISARDANFTHYTVKDGLLNSTVYYAMQDSKGFIWFCTETGVNRFDGRKFEGFTIKDGLADNINFKCYEDKKGRIWFLSYNGQLSFFYKGKIFNKQNTRWLAYKDNGSFLIDCVEDKNGMIWFNTSLGDVLKITDSVVAVIPSPVPEQQHNNSYFSSQLFATAGTGKKLTLMGNNIYESDLLTQTRTFIDSLPDFLNATKFRPGNKDRENENYLLLAGNLVKYNKNNFELLDRGIFKLHTAILSFYDEDSALWIGTAGEGVARMKITQQEITTDYFLKDEAVTSILKDSEGNLWFTTHANSVFLLKNNTNHITVLSSQPAYSIASARLGDIQYNFLGGDHGNVGMYKGLDLIHSIKISSKTLNRINEIIIIDSARVGFFSDESLAYIYNVHTQSYAPTVMQQGFKASSIDTGGGIWICTQENIFRLRNGNLIRVMQTGQLGKLLAFAAVSDSLFYVGTAGKLFKIENSSGPRIIMSDTVLKGGVSDLKIADGVLWVATHGNGIFLLKHDTVRKHLVTENGLTSDVCQKLYDDHKQYMWLGTNNGISIIDKRNGNIFRNLSTSDGLISNDINNISIFDNSIFIATPSGANIFKLNDVIYNSPPPKVYVTTLKKGNESVTDPGDSVSFNFFKGFLNIHFTALSYEAPFDIRYEYKFEHDKEWQETQVTDVTLFGLPPGIHKLLLRAKKHNSQWSNPVVFTLNVKPLWYQSVWFSILAGAVLMLCLYLLFSRRIRQLRQRAEKQNRFEKQITELESKSLAYQMNPHFIFNSLNTVQQFILAKNEKEGLTYLGEFSKLMRQILENSKKTSIFLSEEVAFLRRYMELERTRYSNKFTYSIHLEDALENEDIKIPPMLFQPLLENAVKHGISGIDNGHIQLNLKLRNNVLIGTVEDNGSGIYHIHKTVLSTINRESTALKVLEERVKLIKDAEGKNGTFKVTDKSLTNGMGTIIEIMIPLDLNL